MKLTALYLFVFTVPAWAALHTTTLDLTDPAGDPAVDQVVNLGNEVG